MNLSKTYVQVPCWNQTASIQITLDNDFNVSDLKPDIERIIQEKGRIKIQEIKPMQGKCLIRGNFEFAVLYIGDDGRSRLHAMEGEFPFEEILNIDGLQEQDKMYVRWEIEDLRSGMINSRKINLRSIVILQVEGVRMTDEEIAMALESGENLWVQNKRIPITMACIQGKDQLRVKEEILIPVNRPNMMEIIWHQENLEHQDIKLQDGYIMVRGQMTIFILYRDEMGENVVNDIEACVPIEGRIEMPDVSQEMIPDVKVRLDYIKFDIRDDSDGEARVLGIEAILAAEIQIYHEENLEILQDVYAPNITYIPERKMLQMEHLILKNKSQYPVRERIHLKRDFTKMLQICHTRADVKIDQTDIREEGIDVEGVIALSILYITSDDHKPVNLAKAMIPFNYKIEAVGIEEKDRYDVYPGVDQLSVTMTDSDEIELKMLISLDASILKRIPVEVIYQVKEEPLDYKKMESMPGMIGHIVKEEDTLWMLAKKYYANPESIKEINGLTGDQLTTGQPILIMKNMEIFK